MPYDGNPADFTTTESTPVTVPDVFSLDGLIAWLERQPGGMKYDYMCNGFCSIGLYFRASGVPLPNDYGIGGSHWCDRDGNYRDLPLHFNEISQERPHTIAAALGRAYAYRTDRITAVLAEGS